MKAAAPAASAGAVLRLVTLVLSPHVHAAVIGADVVLLDVQRDEYFCLRDGVRALGLAGDLRALDPPDVATAEALRVDGLAVRGSSKGPPARGCEAPDQDLPPGPAARLHARDLAALGGAIWDYLAHYRGRSFADVLAYAARGATTRAQPEAIRLARVFAKAAPWLPLPRQCLVRSFVLLRFLQRSGADAQWVLGVRTWPFAAHCWLQSGRTALDDCADRLSVYQPILVVG